ncbi:unnamed protein product [Arctogadus glacialis]
MWCLVCNPRWVLGSDALLGMGSVLMCYKTDPQKTPEPSAHSDDSLHLGKTNTVETSFSLEDPHSETPLPFLLPLDPRWLGGGSPTLPFRRMFQRLHFKEELGEVAPPSRGPHGSDPAKDESPQGPAQSGRDDDAETGFRRRHLPTSGAPGSAVRRALSHILLFATLTPPCFELRDGLDPLPYGTGNQLTEVSRPARPAVGQWFGKMPGGGGGLEGGAGLVGETQTPSLGSLGHHSSGRLLPIQRLPPDRWDLLSRGKCVPCGGRAEVIKHG